MRKISALLEGKFEELHRHHAMRSGDRAIEKAIADASSPGMRDDLIVAWQRNRNLR